MSRRQLLSFLIAVILAFFALIPDANALGGPQPPLNQPAPDFTPGCTLEARRFQQDLPKYMAKNTQVLGVSADDVDSHAEFCDSEGLKFPLLADTTGDVSKAYGSWMGYVSLRHTYLIDPQGILKEIYLGVNPAIHSAEVLARLEELQATS
jgi:peroxiredoxin Q/BCP